MMIKISSYLLALLIAMTACGQDQQSRTPIASYQTQTIAVGKGPDALFLTPDENYLYVANGEDAFISVIDTRQDRVVQTIDGAENPWGFTRLGNSNLVAISAWDKGIDLVDFTSHKIVRSKRYQQNLGGITSTRDGKTIFVVATDENKVLRVDANTLQVLGEFKTGNGPDGIGISKDDEKIYVTNTKDGTISIINVNTKTATAITTGGKPELIHHNEDHSRLYISNFVLNKIHILNTETDTIIHEITGLDGPEEAVLSKSAATLFVVNFNSSKVLRYDAKTYARQTQELVVGKQPIGVVSAANDRKLYVTNFGDNTVTVIHW